MTENTPTSDERAALREKAAAAMPGPWEYRHNHPTPDGEGGYYEYDTSEVLLGEDAEFGFQEITALHADAEYIAAVSPSVVLSLLDGLESVTAERDALTAILAEAPHDWEQQCGVYFSGREKDCHCWKSKLPADALAARDARVLREAAGRASEDQGLPRATMAGWLRSEADRIEREARRG